MGRFVYGMNVSLDLRDGAIEQLTARRASSYAIHNVSEAR
jgi:hypothetical protein